MQVNFVWNGNAGKKNGIGCKNGPGMNALYTHQFGGLTAMETINRLGLAWLWQSMKEGRKSAVAMG